MASATDATADQPGSALADRARACAERLRAADSVLLASHVDADGLTSAAVAARTLETVSPAVSPVRLGTSGGCRGDGRS